ncbi:hypothetical protein THRCLA_22109 [Thraustotheca clavata]|uniref:Uncharacterized protein n=1 Tax=Thraustotheca clavata TaxID=74557 RepID=A0A1V9ZCG2_9STRA|nr:hypothetical protein THRCLA_22109 [Thraustotheca clavata]
MDETMERLHALKLSNDVGRKHLNEQYEAMVLEQSRQSQLAMQENAQLRSMLSTLEKQNQSLRHAVQTLEEYRDKHDAQVIQIQQLQDEVQRLKQANFSLQYYLQQTDTKTIHGSFPPYPPDVY